VLSRVSRNSMDVRRLARVILVLIVAELLTAVSGLAAGTANSYHYKGDIQFDLRQVPFSRFGSYLAISDMSQFQGPQKKEGVFLRTMHAGGRTAFRFELLHDGHPVSFTTSAAPTLLTFTAEDGSVEICFDGPERLRMRGKGVQLRLVAVDGWAEEYPGKKWQISTSAMKYMLWPFEGNIAVSSDGGQSGADTLTITFSSASNDGSFDAELDAYVSVWQPHNEARAFSAVEQDEHSAYAHWLNSMPPVSPELGQGAELAAYINWESVVAADGNFKRPAMLMSKNWMASVWSWDHTFNAMALSLSSADLGWNQFMLPVDVQDEKGAFPDMWNAESIAWEYSKPPVHGWALAWMMRHGAFRDTAHLNQIYEPLARWTDWYFQYRDSNGDGLPEYGHGDSSGWDNSTVFRVGDLIESPDLSAYLVIQMDTLADLATRLGKPADAQRWRERSDSLLNKMLQRFWDGHEFVAYRVIDGHEIHSKSLLLSMPIILGKRLPEDVRTALVKDLKQRAEQSPYGVPTEPPDSPFYQPDGYWQGPIWAPATMILVEGLDDSGEHEFADSLRVKFCRMAQAAGMGENFDALTGKSLRDPAYTWTSSVYLLFANELEGENSVRN